jgi:hypothetical protein
MDHANTGRGLKGCLIGLGAVTLAMLLCIRLTTLVMDSTCTQRFESNLPIYPGAEILYTEYIFLDVKQMELYIEEAPSVVRSWYAQQIGVATRNDLQNGTRTAWQGQYIIAAATDNSATQVLLRVVCRDSF